MSAEALKATAARLVEHCRAGTELKGLDELYDPGAVSVEAVAMGEAGRENRGVEAIKGKHAWWNANFEVNSSSVGGPYLHGDDRFAVIFEFEATSKETGERNAMKEVGVYTVDGGGKIVREEFYYTY